MIFPKAKRGKFFRPDTDLNVPVYEHTQHGWWRHYVVFVFAGGLVFAGSWLADGDWRVVMLNVSIAAFLVLVAFMFAFLRVQDEGDWLGLHYGPLPVFRKRIRYADITAVEPDRTKIIDGWGIHYVFGRGWTYNLWGFDCVKLTLGKKTIRVGTDDAERLAEFLRTKIAAAINEN